MGEQIKRYPSIAALARDFETQNAVACNLGHRDSWYGGETAAESVQRAIRGDTSRVAAAEKLLADISAELDVPERPMIADVAGAYPSVPDYLAGAPDCMRRRATVENDESPVRVFFCPTVSADLSADKVMARGVAVLALIIALSRSRPVELHVFNISRSSRFKTRESVIVAPINCQPLDLATAAYVLTAPGFVRRLCFQLARALHFDRDATDGLDWPRDYGKPDYLPGLLRRLGGDPSRDLIIGPGASNDPLIAAPVAWVNAQLAKFREAVQ